MESSFAFCSGVKKGLGCGMRSTDVSWRIAEDHLSRNGSSDLSDRAGGRIQREEDIPRHLSTGPSFGAAAPVKHLTMDNGLRSPAPVRNKLRKQRRSNWSDVNHVQRRLGESLGYLAKTYKELTPDVLLWFQTCCFFHCVCRYQGDAFGLKRALLCFVDHAYGEHENCGDWCGHNREPQAYRLGSSQPSLCDPSLRYKLDNIFRKLSEKSEELACGVRLIDTQYMSGMMEFSFTFPSDEEKGLGCDKRCGGVIRRAEEEITRSELADLPESAECERRCTAVSKEDENTGNDLTDRAQTAECEKRSPGASKEEEKEKGKEKEKEEKKKKNTGNDLTDRAWTAECETRCTGASKEEEENTGNDLTDCAQTAECETRCTGASEEEVEHVLGNDLKGLLESAAAPVDDVKMDDDFTAPTPVQIELRTRRRSNRSDLNNVRTRLGESLENLAKSYEELTPEVLHWFQTSSSLHCIRRYRGDAAGLKRALLSFVDHAYGEHENCEDWCGYNGEPQAYRPGTFQPLSDPSLRPKLSAIFSRFASKSEKVARRSSLKVTPSPSNVLLGKALKAEYLGSPQPLKDRFKNAGYAYLFPESTNHRLSPGRAKKLHSITKARARKPESHQREKDEKQTRKPLREKQKTVPCLSSGDGGDFPSGSETPPLMARPLMEHVVVEQPMTLVFFDLETTSLAKDCEIIQLAAICGGRTFDRYILPVRRICPGASRVTGLTVSKGVLRLHHTALNVVPIREALVEFVDWLKGIGRCILVGHNSKTFDAPRLLLQLDKNGLAKSFCQTILGFLDTLPYFREIKPNLTNHRQETLAKVLLNVKYNAHRALDDVKILQRLVDEFADHAALAKHSFSATWVYKTMKYELRKQENLATFAMLERKEVLSKGLCEKMAGSGLRDSHLRVAHARAISRGELGRDGIKMLLTQRDAEGKIRVTNQGKVLDRIAAFYDREMILGR